MIPPEKIWYSSKDGVKLCGIYHQASKAHGNVVMAHGITADKDEEGLFTRTAQKICEKGYNVLRFDFRAHGESQGKQEDMTISGELSDLEASIDIAQSRYTGLPLALLSTSFGAVSAVIYSATINNLSCLILWNPALDLEKTFLNPQLPWAKKSFNPEGFQYLKENGFLLLDGAFKIGSKLIWEMRSIKPYEFMNTIRCPVLTLHGDKDTYVSYDIAKQYSIRNEMSWFVTIPNSEHGFGRQQDQEIVIHETLHWLEKHIKAKGGN